MNQIKIENVEFEKDIRVIFDNQLEFDRHITEKTNKAKAKESPIADLNQLLRYRLKRNNRL